jgi:alpha-tubulin suppressor-like RCC1 family protein
VRPRRPTRSRGRQFRAVFKNGAGTVTSKAVTLTVTAPPVVTLQPVDASAQEGKEATFKSEASGSPAPTIQWQQSTNGGETYKNVSGATQTTLKLIASKALDNSKYRAVFKNSTGEVTSQAATLHLVEAPHIDIQPLNTTVTEGETAKFNSTAHGTPAPTVQWEVSTNGGSTFTPIEGATSTSLAFTATPEQDGYKYRAVWKNTAGTATSNVVTLTVQGIPKITEQPEDEVVLAGSSVTFEAQATGKPAPTVQWELSTNGGTSYAPIGGATSTTFTIASAQLSESGRLYRAVFKNTAGTATTRGALLTVATTDYRAYGWGQNNRSQTGTGGIFPVDAPLPIPNLSFVTQVSAGGRHSLALQAGGRVYAWGFNGHGQLGNEGEIGTGTPTAIENLTGVTAVAAGGNHSVALLSNGTVKDWGDGESGQLGDNKSTDSEVPVAVSGLSGVKEIAAGEEHTLALLEDGTVVAWGNNEVGQLGTGNTKNSDTPVAVKGLSGVTAIAAGGSFSMALLENGTVVDWGADQRHQLGNKALVEEELGEEFEESEAGPHSETPVAVDGLSNVKAIAAGHTHALALLNDGTVEAWGDNARGELGNGAIEEMNVVASPVTGLSTVKTISAGERGSAAVLSSGAVTTWGTDEDGALGTGTEGEPSPVPVQASNLGQAVGISYGGGHVLAFGEAGPMVTGVSPNEGKMAGGDTVTITGVNFGSASAVHFGAASATFKVESSNTITATSPAGTGTVDVTVTTAAGTSPAKAADHFTYRLAPTVTKLAPKTGPATGGTVVTITGTGFTGVSGVSFGGVPATEVKVVSATSITATAPANAAGTAHVTVTTLGGTSASGTKDRYKYTPVVESVSPANGPVAGGNTVTVSGAGFIAGINTVKFKFGKGSSKSVECTSANSCTVVVPAAKAAGTVDVTAQAAKAKGTLAAGYTFE